MTKKPNSKSYIKISKKGMISMSSTAKKNILKRYENDEKPVYFELIDTPEFNEKASVGTLYFVNHEYDGQRFDATKEICCKAADKIVEETFDAFDEKYTAEDDDEDFTEEFLKANSSSNVVDLLNYEYVDGNQVSQIQKTLVSDIRECESFYIGKVKFIKINRSKNPDNHNSFSTYAIDNNEFSGYSLTTYIASEFPNETINYRKVYSQVYGTPIPTEKPFFVTND